MDTDRIERETLIDAPLERVWAVITSPGAWVGEGDPSKLDIREGADIIFEMGEVRMHQVVEKIEPMRYISYRWAPYTVFKGEAPRPGNSTLVEFIVSTAGNQTLLRVIESGFDSLDTETDLRRKAFEDNDRGWSMVLPDLKQRAEQPAA